MKEIMVNDAANTGKCHDSLVSIFSSCDLDIFSLLAHTNNFTMIYHSPLLTSKRSSLSPSAVCFTEADFTCFRQHITHTSREAWGEGCRQRKILLIDSFNNNNIILVIVGQINLHYLMFVHNLPLCHVGGIFLIISSLVNINFYYLYLPIKLSEI